MATPRRLTRAKDDEDVLNLDNQLCFALYATSRAITSVYRPALDELGITYPQYLVLLVLWERDGLGVGELGERLFLDSGTLTPLLKRLEKQGLITRRRDTDDERHVNVTLTLAGSRMKRNALAMATTLQCKLQLPKGKVDALRNELKQLMKIAIESGEPS